MGFSIFQLETKFRLAEKFHARALEKIKALCWGTPDDPWLPEPGIRHRSFVDDKGVLEAKDLFQAMGAWRWCAIAERDLNPDMPTDKSEGDIVDLDFVGESWGEEDLLFATLAEFVEDGSYIAMADEDHGIWRWYFKRGQCFRQEGRLVFEEPAA